jgi:predicted tellurium resistance membrane protein TerC
MAAQLSDFRQRLPRSPPQASRRGTNLDRFLTGTRRPSGAAFIRYPRDRLMDWLTDPNAWIGLLTLTLLEIVLGVDNIIFISILAGKLPVEQRARARQLGLLGAFFSRLLLLLSIAWVVRLTTPLFSVLGVDVSGRGLILILGGLFLIGKATHEIHDKLEGEENADGTARAARSLAAVVAQIMVIDIVFSLDSVITAVGMVDQVAIMIAANVVALGIMLFASTPISDFVDRHPTVKMLALSFLVLIGTNLVAEGIGQHIPKGYTYFAMAFSVLVEMLNIRVRAKSGKGPLKLRDTPHHTPE